MPYYKCRKCHHEFEAIPLDDEELSCDWCGSDNPTILELKTPLETMCGNWEKLMETLKDGSICERSTHKSESTRLRRKRR